MTMTMTMATTMTTATTAIWQALAPALGNHLWQSTLFAVTAALLTLILRRNHARARYGLWLAASLKFLIPFSLLVGLGSHLAWTHASVATSPSFYSTMQQVSQPFAQGIAVPPAISPAASATLVESLLRLFPAVLAAVWLVGFLRVLAVWCARWRRLSRAIRDAAPLREGREAEALRKLESIAGIRQPISLLLSRAPLEPGIFGVARPVLVWPEGISARLDDAHLEAILAHEVQHVRRRDNLVAAIHMLVEAIFWFHPLVWWLGARLVEERELACDEEVLALGNQPGAYAESILKVCEFCVESPLACVSGVTGADLKKRIVRIMSETVSRKLDFSRKLLLAAVGAMAIGVPVVLGLVAARPRLVAELLHPTDPLPSFEVASIKPGRPDQQNRSIMIGRDTFKTGNASTRMLIELAYQIQTDNQLSGGPSWIDSAQYDIDAKIEDSFVEKMQKLPIDQRAGPVKLMVQSLLASRFNLKVHYATKDLPIYALVIGKGGSKLTERTDVPRFGDPGASPAMAKGCCGIRQNIGGGQMEGTGTGTDSLADVLSKQPEIGRTVINQTGLKGKYDWTLKWTPEHDTPMFKSTDRGTASANPPPADSFGPSLFAAIEEQLGLKLEAKKGPVEVLVIDHIERPSEN